MLSPFYFDTLIITKKNKDCKHFLNLVYLFYFLLIKEKICK